LVAVILANIACWYLLYPTFLAKRLATTIATHDGREIERLPGSDFEFLSTLQNSGQNTSVACDRIEMYDLIHASRSLSCRLGPSTMPHTIPMTFDAYITIGLFDKPCGILIH
jgi:hypothetical protein